MWASRQFPSSTPKDSIHLRRRKATTQFENRAAVFHFALLGEENGVLIVEFFQELVRLEELAVRVVFDRVDVRLAGQVTLFLSLGAAARAFEPVGAVLILAGDQAEFFGQERFAQEDDGIEHFRRNDLDDLNIAVHVADCITLETHFHVSMSSWLIEVFCKLIQTQNNRQSHPRHHR